MNTTQNLTRAELYRQNKIAKTTSSGEDEFISSRQQERNINLFFYGILSYVLIYVVSVTNNKILTPAVCQGLQVISLLLLITSSIKLLRFKFDNKYLETIFTVYFVYSLTIIGRTTNFQYDAIKSLIFHPVMGILPYLLPLAVLLPRKFTVLKKAFDTLIILGVAFFIFIIAYFNIVHDGNWANITALSYTENFFGEFAFPVGFILLTYIYHPKKENIFALAVLIISLYFLIFRARRGSMFLCITTLVGAGMVYLVYTKRTAMVIVISIFLVVFGSVFMSNIKLPSMFDFLMSRGDEDTRTGMEVYMKADMTIKDWIIGKGIDGTYFCPVILDPNDLSGRRNIIETGYLQMCLKGGLIQLILLLLILIPAIYKGFFKSKNILCKGLGIYLLLCIIYMYPTIVTGFGMYAILVWIAIGICYSDKIRNMSDTAIKAYLERFK